MLKRIDIYLLRQELTGFVATIGIVVILLSLENSQRLWDFVSGTDAPGLLMLRMMGSLVPEYIGVGLPIDVLVVRTDVCDADLNHRIEAGEPYFHDLRSRWSAALRAAHQNIPRPPYKKD